MTGAHRVIETVPRMSVPHVGSVEWVQTFFFRSTKNLVPLTMCLRTITSLEYYTLYKIGVIVYPERFFTTVFK